MPSALAGIRVIDFGQYIAGPLTGMLLADQGADVMRVDPSGGPVWDTPANATWNRGKRSISLDLKQPGDLDMDRLGLGKAIKPHLLFVSQCAEGWRVRKS